MVRAGFNPDDPSTWPLVMVIDEVAAVMRRTAKGIHHGMAHGTFAPLPFEEKPYRWKRDDIQAWLRGDYREATQQLRARAREAVTR